MHAGPPPKFHGTRAVVSDSPAAFFALTFLLSVPIYVLNSLAYLNIVGRPQMGAVYISLLTATPIASASILMFRSHGIRGLKQLLGRIFDFKRIAKSRWYVVIVFLTPVIFLLSLGVMIVSGAPISPALAPLVALPAVFPFLFLLGAGEEVGWMGYAFEPMERRSGALRAALVLGMVWAFWHVPFFAFTFPDPVVLSAQVLTLVGTRVLIAWVFNNTGKSVFAAILFHAADNTALVILPEVNTSSPWGAVLVCGFVLSAAVVVTLLWGPRTLARYRFAREG